MNTILTEKIKVLIGTILGVILLFLFCACSVNIEDKGTSIEPVIDIIHSGTEEYTDFDLWLLKEVCITGTPSNIIINDNHIIGFIDTATTYKELKEQEGSLNIDITNIRVNDKLLSDYNLLIVKRPDCMACAFQEQNGEDEILQQYNKVLIYYILSENIEEGCLDGCE